MDIEIIDNTREARDEYGHLCGSWNVALIKEHIQALLNGKCIAFNDGEYSQFVSMEGTSDD